MSKFPTEMFDSLYDLRLKLTDSYGNHEKRDGIEEKIEQLIQAHGYSRVGKGGYRAVYGTDDHVVKVALNPQGVLENEAEYGNWMIAKDKDVICSQNDREYIDAMEIKHAKKDGRTHSARRYLASIMDIANSGGWLVMDRVESSGNVTLEEAKKVSKVLEMAGIHIEEIVPYNMGRVDGRPVVFDYGGT